MGREIEIGEEILEEKADSLLALKANHETAYGAVQAHFEDRCFGSGALKRGAESWLRSDGVDESHGRAVRRRVFTCSEVSELEALSEWPQLKSVVGAQAIRTVKGESETNAEIRYFLSSRKAEDERLKDAAGTPPSRTACTGQVTLPSVKTRVNEDQSRVRDETAALGWAEGRKMALNLLKSDSEADTRGPTQTGGPGQRLHERTPSRQSYTLALQGASRRRRPTSRPRWLCRSPPAGSGTHSPLRREHGPTRSGL